MIFRSFILIFLTILAPACTKIGYLNSVVPREGYAVTQDISYGDLERQKLDIYLPPNVGNDTPVVVFFYGGSWQYGDRGDYLFIGQSLAALGYITVIPDYRVFPAGKYPDFLRDSAQAVVWTYKNIRRFGGNSENLYLMGHSAGAYNVMMITMNRNYLADAGGSAGWIRGAVGISGPYDFLPITREKVKAVFATETNLPKTQPINYVRSRLPRMLLLTGLDDETVTSDNSEKLYAKLKQYGNRVELKKYPGIGHRGIMAGLATPLSWNTQVRADVREFINKDD